MKMTLFLSFTLFLLALLTGCGTFRIEGERLLVTPTDSSGGDVLELDPAGDNASSPPVERVPTLLNRLNLPQIIAILGLFGAFVVGVGAYLLIRRRTPESDYAPIPDLPDGKKTPAQLLRFQPDGASVLLALAMWAGIIGVAAVVTTVGLLLGQDFFAEEWEPSLTHPSSILIGADSPRIRLLPEKESCLVRSQANGDWDLLCDVPFEGATLSIEAQLEERTIWRCDAQYGGRTVPCRASFDNLDFQTYVVVESNLALAEARYQELVTETANIGWSERDWIWLARGVVTLLSIGVLGLLWRFSGQKMDASGSARFLRILYSAGVTLLFFGAANYVSLVMLLAFNQID